jgi:peptidoglycan/LPS O-acetylase OafA/YrhL
MIEISRYILAAMVAQTHLWPLGVAWTGTIAVFAFYTLSGYLITRVLLIATTAAAPIRTSVSFPHCG